MKNRQRINVFALALALLLVVTICRAQKAAIIVSADGTGKYKTVQAAFDALAAHDKTPVTIFIKKGVYKEKLRLDSSKSFVTLIGEDKFNTILTWDDHTGKVSPQGKVINTNTSHSFIIYANNFTAENITFQNDAGFNAGQAVAVEVQGDKTVFRNCRFTGFQDVLYTNSARSREYFENCYIEGTTDFIFGSATALFVRCHIHSKKTSHVTAAATPKENRFGYVFYDCVLTADSSIRGVSLGRPWQPYASVNYLYCYIGPHILPEGWNNWKNPVNEKTARFTEYKNYGPGANAAARFPWSRQLTDEEAEQYTVKNIFGDWDPQGKTAGKQK